MRNNVWTVALVVFVVLVLGLAFAQCSGSDGADPEPEPTTTIAPVVVPPQPGADSSGGPSNEPARPGRFQNPADTNE